MFSRDHYYDNFCGSGEGVLQRYFLYLAIILFDGDVVLKILIIKRPFFQRSGTICATLVEGIMRERFCEVILNFKVVQECCSGGQSVGQNGTICAIFIEGILETFLLFKNMDQGVRRMRCRLNILLCLIYSTGGHFGR